MQHISLTSKSWPEQNSFLLQTAGVVNRDSTYCMINEHQRVSIHIMQYRKESDCDAILSDVYLRNIKKTKLWRGPAAFTVCLQCWLYFTHKPFQHSS